MPCWNRSVKLRLAQEELRLARGFGERSASRDAWVVTLSALLRMTWSFLSCCLTDQFWIAYDFLLDFYCCVLVLGILPHALYYQSGAVLFPQFFRSGLAE